MKKLLTLVAILSVVGISCIKREYDLNKELDLNVRIDGKISIPIAESERLFLKDFIDPDSIEMLVLYNGGYAIVFDSAMTLPLDELNDFGNLGTDTITETFSHPLEFGEFGEFPTDMLDGVSETIRINENITSGFYLDPPVLAVVNTIRTTLFGGTMSLAELNALGTNPAAAPLFASAGIFNQDEIFPISDEGDFKDTIEISVHQALGDFPFITAVNTIWLQNSSFNIAIKVADGTILPNGATLNLDQLRLEFPNQINLDVAVGHPGVKSKHVFDTTNIAVSNTGTVNLTIPVRSFTDIYKNGNIELLDSIKVFASYSLGGSYSGGSFPNSKATATALNIDVSAALNFEAATISLNTDEITKDLSFKEVVDIKESFHIPEIEIVQIQGVTLKGTPQIRLDLAFESPSTPNLTGSIVDDLEITLKIDFPNIITFSPPLPQNIYQHKINFTNGVAAPILLNIQGLDLSTLPIVDGEIVLDDQIEVSATVSLKTSTFTVPDPIFNLDDLVLNVNARIDSIVLKSITANMRYDLDFGDEIETIDLSEHLELIEKYVNRDSLVLDFVPFLELILNTNLQVPLGAELVLMPWRNGAELTQNAVNLTLNISPAPTEALVAHKFFIGTVAPPDQSWQHKNVNLASIIKTIPDSIQIRIGGGISPLLPVTFDFTRTYKADMNFRFVVPFAVGPDFRLPIEYTFDSLSSTIGKWLEGSKIGLGLTTLTDIPLTLIATATPVDSNNKPLTGVKPAVLEIKAGNASGAVETISDLTFDDRDSKQLSKMRGVHLHFVGKTGPGMANVPIKPDNFIQLKLNAQINGGITIDLREGLGSGNEEGGNE